MPFFQVDDQFHLNRKTELLIDMGQVGIAAIGLWTVVGSKIQAGETPTDGRVPATIWRTVGDKRLFAKLAKLLVQVGLWDERPADDPDGWLYDFHDWAAMKYTPAAKLKQTRARTKEMKDSAVTEAVKARDGNLCRYCGKKVSWDDRVSDRGATYDHVVPGIAAGVRNLVVACRGCNRKKAQRTPEQANMPLLPPPHGPDSEEAQTAAQGVTASGPVLVSDQNPEQKSGGPPRAGSRTGTGPGSGTGSGLALLPGTDAGEPPPPDTEPRAGAAPAIPPTPGRDGSPYYRWTGPPDPNTEPRCPDHDNPMPCRRCTAQHYADEADPR